MAHARIVVAFIVICILSEFVTACGGDGKQTYTPPSTTAPGAPTIGTPTAGNAQVTVNFTAPASNGGAAITNYTATCTSASAGSVSGTASKASSPIIVTGLTNGDPYTCKVYATNSAGNGPSSAASVAITPAVPATVPGAPTIVSVVAGNAQVTVNFTAPANGGASITSYTVTSNPGAITATGTSSPIIVTGLTNGDPYTFTVYATNSAGNGPASAASAAVTPELPNPVITSVNPVVTYCVGACAGKFIYLTGDNFATTQFATVAPDSNLRQWIVQDSSHAIFSVMIDSPHQGSGWRKPYICTASNGTGCSNTIPFGLYGPNACGVTPSGEKLCLNPMETADGKTGYVDKFKPITGAPDGRCYTGAPSAIAVDDLTGWFGSGVNPIDPATCLNATNAPSLSGTGDGSYPEMAVKAKNGYLCYLDPTALTCVSWLGGSNATNPIMVANFGTDNQSLAMGVTNNKTYAYAFDAGGGALYKVDVTDGTTVTLSWPVTGYTTGTVLEPHGTEIVLFDSLGLGMLVSYSNNIAIVFDETTLKSAVGDPIALPGTPVSVIAKGNIAVIGNADQANSGGNFTVVDPVNRTATLIPSATVPFLPTNLIPAVVADGAGIDFYACPQDGSSCVPFTLP